MDFVEFDVFDVEPLRLKKKTRRGVSTAQFMTWMTAFVMLGAGMISLVFSGWLS